ncbi:tripeptidyl-peptidase (secreted protein) [Venturia nashicola]|uniref:tripeptidyl-peptidase II n=1 Tax=Venturia nashicola TaxID=86259 RepID=A0A4Z1NW41_9PEZI|nr:tripeptidyl-peptidase (secreted protein) [Venturia nashicola]
MVSKTILGAFALLFAAGSNAARAMKRMESVSHAALASQGWAVARRPASQESITLQIALTLQNTEKMISTLLDRSNQKSPNYGKWLDRDEVNAIVQPSAEANKAVVNWLKSEGVSKVHSDGTVVTLATTIETANRILNANFQGYQRSGIAKVRTVEYSVPHDVAEHIDVIHPTTFFGSTQAFAPVHAKYGHSLETVKMSHLETRQGALLPTEGNNTKQQTVTPDCAIIISPACIKQLYNIGNYTALATSGSKIGFGSFLNQSASWEDLKLFNEYFQLPQHNFTKVEVTKGAATPPVLEVAEANLDIQSVVGVAYPLPITEFLTGGSPPFIPDLEMTNETRNTNEPYLPYYQYLLSLKNSELPQAISNSYGEPEQTVPRAYAERTCILIAMMGLRGVTVMESSGDTGIGAGCLSNDGKKRKRFDPQFPSTCPWITSVGGTQAVNPEIAWVDSSGGFSDYFPRPSYQADAVETYFTKRAPEKVTTTWLPYYNNKGRAFPDISAHSLTPYYLIFENGEKSLSGGTSAAVPVMAGIIGLLNDARLRAGLPTLGFINPWLYGPRSSEFIIDITGGASRGCDGINWQQLVRLNNSGIIPGATWNATIGWDPVTGLGIPDFQKMLKSALNKKDGGQAWAGEVGSEWTSR